MPTRGETFDARRVALVIVGAVLAGVDQAADESAGRSAG